MVGRAHETLRVRPVRNHAAYLRHRPALIWHRAGCLVGRLRSRHWRCAIVGDRKVQVVDGRIGAVPPVLIEHHITTRANGPGGLVVDEIAAAVGVETCEMPNKSRHAKYASAALFLVDERVCGRSHDDELARRPVIVVVLAQRSAREVERRNTLIVLHCCELARMQPHGVVKARLKHVATPALLDQTHGLLSGLVLKL